MTDKYQVGDKVHIEFTVERVVKNAVIPVVLELYRSNSPDGMGTGKLPYYVEAGNVAIVKHIQGPLKVGDTVCCDSKYVRDCDKGQVLAIHGDRAWVIFNGDSVPRSPCIGTLVRVDCLK